jgi:preprotein translocase subunit SecE
MSTASRTGSKPMKGSAGNPFSRMKGFYHGVMTEMGKVSWPSKEDLKTYTIVVLVSAVMMSIVFGAWDVLLAYLLQLLLQVGA